MRLQFWHLIVLLLVVLLLFGANRLPDLARSVGKSMKILKEEVKDLRDEPSGTPPVVPPTPPPSADDRVPPTDTPDDAAPRGPSSGTPGAHDR